MIKSLISSGLILSSVAMFVNLLTLPAAQAQQQVLEQPKLMILPFENINQDPELKWLGASLAENLVTALSYSTDIRVIERRQIKAVLNEQGFSQSQWVKPQEAPKLGQLLGANKILLGSYQKNGNKITVYARIVDSENGQIEAGKSIQIEGDTENLQALQQKLAETMAQRLQISPSSSLKNYLKKGHNTTSLKAYELYHKAVSKSISAFDSNAMTEATVYLKEALKLDPEYTQAYALMAEVLASRTMFPEIFTGGRPDDLQQALKYVELAAQTQKHPAAVYRALAQIYAAKNNLEEADKALAEALKLKPRDQNSIILYIHFKRHRQNNYTNYSQLSQELLQLGADLDDPWMLYVMADLLVDQARKNPEDIASLRPLMAKLQIKLPGHAFARLLQAEMALLEEQEELAIKLALESIQLIPDNALAYFLGGNILVNTHSWELGHQYFRKAIQLNPQLSYAHMILGMSLLAHGEIKASEQVLREGYAISPESTILPFFLAMNFQNQKRFAEAYALLHQALKNYGNNISERIYAADIELSLVETCYALNKKTEAQRIMNKLIQNNHFERDKEFRNLIYLSLQHESLDLAENYFKAYQDWKSSHPKYQNYSSQDKKLYRHIFLRKALQTNPKDPLVLNDIGYLNLESNKLSEAEKYFIKALQFAPENASIYYNLGLLYVKQQRHEMAEDHFLRALQLNPKHLKAQFNLGQLYYGQKKYSQARKVLEALILQDPDHREALKILGNIAKP